MADLIALSVLAVQYFLIVFAVYYVGGQSNPKLIAGIFLLLAIAGIVYWHKKKSTHETRHWLRLIISSLKLGAAFYAIDFLISYLHIRGGGGLGLPLTILVCPVFTMICVAGLVRAVYISRTQPSDRAQSSTA